MPVLPAPPSAPALRIASRRSGIDRVWGSVLAALVLVIVALVVAVSLLAAAVDDAMAFSVLLPVAPFLLFVLGVTVHTWRKLRSIATPLELDAHGLVLRSPQGEVRCPWGAVTSVGFGRIGLLRTRILVIRLHPQAGPGVSGIESTVPARSWRTLHRHGLRYAVWLLDIGDGELAAAFAERSGGRVHLRPQG